MTTEYASTLFRTETAATNACVADWATACGSDPFPQVDADLAQELADAHNGGDWPIVNVDGELTTERATELLEAARGDESSAELCELKTGDVLRMATWEEQAESIEAAKHDGGVGAIEVDGTTCYVER